MDSAVFSLVLYADDTVIYVSGKNHSITQDTLTLELDSVANWLSQNNLILKEGKTDFILFGTHQKLRVMDKIVIVINHIPVNEAKIYKYLGVFLDKNLTLHDRSNFRIPGCSNPTSIDTATRLPTRD